MDVIDLISLIELLNRRSIRPDRIMRDRRNPFDNFSEEEFIRRFRFSKSGVWVVLDRLNLQEPTSFRGNPVPPIMLLLITLRFLATGTFQMMIGDNFDVDASTVCRAIKTISKAVVAKKNEEFVFPPTNASRVKSKFSQLAGCNFPGVIGAIDCTHIRILDLPLANSQLFYNRKQYYSINCQYICDGDRRILDLVARWPGSTHDSRIFRNSSAKSKLEQGDINGFIVGDAGYPCSNYLLTPIANPTTAPERVYNSAHCQARLIVERLFGTLKKRFPALHYGLRLRLTNSLNAIIAASILFNWSLELNESEDLFDDIDFDDNDDEDIVQQSRSAFRSAFIATYFG